MDKHDNDCNLNMADVGRQLRGCDCRAPTIAAPTAVSEDERFAAFDRACAAYAVEKMRGTHKSSLLAACRAYAALAAAPTAGDARLAAGRSFLNWWNSQENKDRGPDAYKAAYAAWQAALAAQGGDGR